MDSLQSELEEEFGEDVPEKLKELLTVADAVPCMRSEKRMKIDRILSDLGEETSGVMHCKRARFFFAGKAGFPNLPALTLTLLQVRSLG